MPSYQKLRQQKDDFFRGHPHSPLTPDQQRTFTGLAYYAPNPALRLNVTVEQTQQPQRVLINTTGDELRPFFKFGAFAVSVEGASVRLTIYRSDDDHYFLPFADANAGIETYPAGRYLDLEPGLGGVFTVDFNLAYNPYCAYNDLYICPITPAENRVDVPIRAGEKLPQGEWVGA
jgi:uncharacterized protein